MARAGRKRKMAKREPNGRAQRPKDFRDIEAEQNRRPMVEARMRLHGLNEDAARDQKAETAVGRWCLRGEISEQQWQAAEQYLKDARAYSWAVNSPRGSGAVDLSATARGNAGEESEYEAERATKARRKFSDAMGALIAANLDHAGVSEAIATVVLQGHDVPEVVGLVRLGLNALAHHYGFSGTRKVA